MLSNMSKHEKDPEIPEPFRPHHNLSERLNQMIAEKELQGGVDMKKMAIGSRIEILTRGDRYVIEKRSDGYYISGHPDLCPKPTKITYFGSVWGDGTSIINQFAGRGMRLEFRFPWQKNKSVEGTDEIMQPFFRSPEIEDVRELKGASDEEVLKEYEIGAAEGMIEIKEKK